MNSLQRPLRPRRRAGHRRAVARRLSRPLPTLRRLLPVRVRVGFGTARLLCAAGDLGGGDDEEGLDVVCFDVDEERGGGVCEAEVEREGHGFGVADAGLGISQLLLCEGGRVRWKTYVELAQVECNRDRKYAYVVRIELACWYCNRRRHMCGTWCSQ